MTDVRYAVYEATFEQLEEAVNAEDRLRLFHLRKRLADLPLMDRLVAQLAAEDVVARRGKRGREELKGRVGEEAA